MKTAIKWLPGIGALIFIVSSFLPMISTSNIRFNLFQIAGLPGMFFLYLVPILFIVLAVLPLIPVKDDVVKKYYLIAQFCILFITILMFLGTFVYFLISMKTLSNFPIAGGLPGIGILVGLLGLGITTAAIVADFVILLRSNNENPVGKQIEPAVADKPVNELKPELEQREVYLVGKKGNFDGQKIWIKGDDYSIGRSSGNDLKIDGKEISRLHVRIRYSQGEWFAQDQGSKIGIQINGKDAKAARLNSGDLLKIGDEEFVFYINN